MVGSGWSSSFSNSVQKPLLLLLLAEKTKFPLMPASSRPPDCAPFVRKPQPGAIPFSVSSPIACAFLERCVNPMPRNTFGALENWILS
jgi:hypothetical protein